jgi:hypothetical protein
MHHVPGTRRACHELWWDPLGANTPARARHTRHESPIATSTRLRFGSSYHAAQPLAKASRERIAQHLLARAVRPVGLVRQAAVHPVAKLTVGLHPTPRLAQLSRMNST